ncbi:chaperone NapD [Saccharophagus degradans]|uniref:Chaperone NapD n=1 Tax=Saccharophagus degradans (strain 2-40 / ATCC 43961 / DSM 17024) TaxID=203122 RepID=Q21PN2_SACD2|nr:chaperone NapD [Saccharophagus degradans]ABD79347.1 NapD [Saccharophagus degradans 2-40]
MIQIQQAQEPVHITSFILLVQHGFAEKILRAYANNPDIEICQTEQPEKLLVLAEAEDTQRIRDYMDEFAATEGVISTTLVYHHAESESALREAL